MNDGVELSDGRLGLAGLDGCDAIRGRIDRFLTGPMAALLQAVDYRAVDFGQEPISIADAARCTVEVAHASGSPEARYRLHAFDQRLQMQIQLNVYRLVVVYSIPQAGSLDSDSLKPRFSRWELGANHAGWRIGWRDAVGVDDPAQRSTEIYCYAMLPEEFLDSERHQLYWMNDIVQMTRALFLEARRIDCELS